MVVDELVGVGLNERETINAWVWWVGDASDAVEGPAPDNVAAVVDDVIGDDCWGAWLAEGVVDVGFSVRLNDRAKLCDDKLVIRF